MLKGFFKLLVFVAIVCFVIYKYFLFYDPSINCLIKIKPSIVEFSANNIKEAINILKKVAPEEYSKVCEYVDKINPNYSCGGIGGGCYTTSPSKVREIDISTVHKGFLGWTAAVIVHETCHAAQRQQNRPIVEDECHELADWLLKNIVKY